MEDIFFDPIKRTKSPIREIVEEINLMYVSITRAIKEINIKSTAIQEILDTPKKDFIKHLKSRNIVLDPPKNSKNKTST